MSLCISFTSLNSWNGSQLGSVLWTREAEPGLRSLTFAFLGSEIWEKQGRRFFSVYLCLHDWWLTVMISVPTNPVFSLESILFGSNLEDPFHWLIPLHHYFISLAENDILKKSITPKIPPVLRLVLTPAGIIAAATSLGITPRSKNSHSVHGKTESS